MSLNNVPLTGQTLVQTRDLIAQNFSVINTGFSVNHVQFNDAGLNQGFHNFVTLPSDHSIYPLLATSATQTGIYCSDGTSSHVPEIFFQRNSKGIGGGYAVTESGGGIDAGWFRLPNGAIIYYGKATTTANSNPSDLFDWLSSGPGLTSIFASWISYTEPSAGTDPNSVAYIVGVTPSTSTHRIQIHSYQRTGTTAGVFAASTCRYYILGV